jgi:hypothetical protein
MGQYYKPTILDDNNTPISWMRSHDYDNGMKLMEHSWVGNSFVNSFAHQLNETLAPDGKRVVWAGDYADTEPGTPERNIYSLCIDRLHIRPATITSLVHFPFIVNLTKKVYVNINRIDKFDGFQDKETEWKIHPLPLLTCEGNGRGGGDFNGDDPNELVGSWARDVIRLDRNKPDGFEELLFGLME